MLLLLLLVLFVYLTFWTQTVYLYFCSLLVLMLNSMEKPKFNGTHSMTNATDTLFTWFVKDIPIICLHFFAPAHCKYEKNSIDSSKTETTHSIQIHFKRLNIANQSKISEFESQRFKWNAKLGTFSFRLSYSLSMLRFICSAPKCAMHFCDNIRFLGGWKSFHVRQLGIGQICSIFFYSHGDSTISWICIIRSSN